MDRHPGKDCLNSCFPGFVKLHAVDRGEDLNPIGRAARLNHGAGLGEIQGSKAQVPEPKPAEHIPNPTAIVDSGIDKKVGVTREPRISVEGHRMASYQQPADSRLV